MSEAKIQNTLLRQGALSSMQDLGRWNYESTEIHVKVTSCALLSLKYSFMGVDKCAAQRRLKIAEKSSWAGVWQAVINAGRAQVALSKRRVVGSRY